MHVAFKESRASTLCFPFMRILGICDVFTIPHLAVFYSCSDSISVYSSALHAWGVQIWIFEECAILILYLPYIVHKQVFFFHQ